MLIDQRRCIGAQELIKIIHLNALWIFGLVSLLAVMAYDYALCIRGGDNAVLTRNKGSTGLVRHGLLKACANVWTLSLQQRHSLTLHV